MDCSRVVATGVHAGCATGRSHRSLRGGGLLRCAALVTVLGLLTACAHVGLYKEGLQMEEGGQHYAAANSALKSLDKKPGYQKAKDLLARTAEPGFIERERDAQGNIDGNQFPAAIAILQELQTFSMRCSAYGVRVPAAEGIAQRIEEVTNAGAKTSYDAAESHLKAKEYEEAIAAYAKALDLVAGYKDARDKTALCHRTVGDGLKKGRQWRDAAQRYENAASFANDSTPDKTAAADCYYAMGTKFLANKQYRNAYVDLERAFNLVGEFKDVTDLKEKCLQQGLVRLAIFPLTNRSGIQPAGISVSDALYDEILSDLQQRCSPFLQVIDRNSLDLMLQEQGLGAAAKLMDSATVTQAGKIRGVHYLLTGKITKLLPKENSPTNRPKSIAFQVPVYQEVQAGYGTVLEKIGTANARFSYEEHEQSAEIAIGGSLQITDAASGRSAMTKKFDVRLSDAVEYATDGEWSYPPAAHIDDTGELWKHMGNDALRQKFSARPCRSLEDLTTDAIRQLREQFVTAILEKLDSVPKVADPVK